MSCGPHERGVARTMYTIKNVHCTNLLSNCCWQAYTPCTSSTHHCHESNSLNIHRRAAGICVCDANSFVSLSTPQKPYDQPCYTWPGCPATLPTRAPSMGATPTARPRRPTRSGGTCSPSPSAAPHARNRLDSCRVALCREPTEAYSPPVHRPPRCCWKLHRPPSAPQER